MARSNEPAARGLALVEVVLIATIVAIIAGIAIIALTATTDAGSSRTTCRKEAAAFQKAVQTYHDKEHHWPGEDPKVKQGDTPAPAKEFGLVADELLSKRYIPHSLLARIDGSQRVPTTNVHGWVYLAKDHVTFAGACS